MTIAYAKGFLKQAKRLDPSLRRKVYESILLFSQDPLRPQLRNHPLKGKWRSYRSIDVTGDVRALYLQRGEEALFVAVGTHSQLYG